MKILKNFMLIASLATLSITSYAQNNQPTLPKIWIKKSIKPKINSYLSGYIPYFFDKKWQFLNQSIHHWVVTEFDNTDAKAFKGNMEIEVTPIYQDKNLLSFALNMQINDFTARYFTEYYTLDLPHHRLLTLSNYLTQKNIRYATVRQAIKQYLQPCVDDYKESQTLPSQCEDIAIGSLIGTQESLDANFNIPDDKHFFIAGKDKLGVAFNSSKFTASFVYDEKTGKIALAKF